MFEIADPLIFLLAPLPLLVARFVKPRRMSGRALLAPDHIVESMSRAERKTAGALQTPPERILLWVIWALTLAALSGPRDLEPVSALKVSGRDLAIALDLSGSMVRDDFWLEGQQITRLDAVKTVGAEFARRRGGDRVALIIFGSEAYYAAPFTFDTQAVARRIEEAVIGVSGRATNISDGLGLALKRMEKSEAASKVVILLSDGVNNAGATNPRGVADWRLRWACAFTPSPLARKILKAPKPVSAAWWTPPLCAPSPKFPAGRVFASKPRMISSP